MNRHYLTSAFATLAMSSLLAIPVLAQDGLRSGGRPRAEGQGRSENRSVERAGPQAAAPRTASPRSISPGFSPAPRAQAVPRNDPRFDGRFAQRGVGPSPRFSQERGIQARPRFESRFDQRRYIQPRVIRPGIVLSRPYYRPFYTFRPRFSLGFGIWAGYPVLYSSYGYYPYGDVYPAPYPETTYPVPAPGTVAPSATGGLSFDITPPDAEVYIDGQDAGAVDQFAPNEQPLTLGPGRHRVEVNAPGYQSLGFDVDILPGQVIPYQGAMQPR
jgi:hypothetical protein